MLSVVVKEVGPKGVDLQGKMDGAFIGVTKEEGIVFDTPVSVNAHVERVEDVLVANVHTESRITTHCARCLEELKQPWQKDFTLDIEFQSINDTIDMGDDIRQEILLNIPQRLLCQEACKGICPMCGVNLNEQTCACVRPEDETQVYTKIKI